MVVEPDPIQNHLPCLGSGRKLSTVNVCRFQVPPQALGWGVIPAIYHATHRADNAPLLECGLEAIAAILTAPVAVKDQALGRSATPALTEGLWFRFCRVSLMHLFANSE
jgi:hypothetical protein